MRKDMNFFLQLQGKRKQSQQEGNNALLIGFTGLVAAIIIVTLGWNIINLAISGMQIKSYQNKLNDSEVQAKLVESDDVNLKTDTLSKYDNQITTILGAVSSREVVTTKLLNQISGTRPTGVTFSNITVKSTDLTMTGTSTSRTAIAEIEHNLGKLDCVQSVFVDSISGEETKLIFSIKCTLKDVE